MLTTKFVFLGLVLSAKAFPELEFQKDPGKCCPPEKIFSDYTTAECVSKPRNATELYVHEENISVEFQGIPRCKEPEDLMITSLDDFNLNFLEMPACVEILYSEEIAKKSIVIVYCRSEEMEAINAFLPQLAHVRKCCPRDTIFDSRTKACVSQLNESESIVAFLGNGSTDANLITIISEGPPTCKGPIVDYVIDENDVFLWNDTYSVSIPIWEDGFIVKKEFLIAENNTCLDTTPNSALNRTLIARVCRDPEFCEKNACIRKCGAENEFFYSNQGFSKSVPDDPIEFHVAFANAVNQTESSAFDLSKDYGVLIGKPCKHGMYPLDSTEKWLLTPKGHVYVEDYTIYDQSKYCMDIFYNMSAQDFKLFICFEDPSKNLLRFEVNTALQITSCVFLLITLLVYAYLPSLQNLHGKTLMCHVSSLLLAFICLPIIAWITTSNMIGEQSSTSCKVLAYISLFCFLSSFSWLNVMCFDIWWTFGVLRGSTITKAREHRKKFLLYCLYAWGLSFLISILAIIADISTDVLPKYLQPGFGINRCWFTSQQNGELIFFIGPITIMLISNVVFFVLTSIHCNKVKAEIKRVTTDPTDPRRKRFYSDRKRFIMNVKLFTVMGMSWIMEVVSFFLLKYLNNAHWHHIMFYTSDVFNCLQGLLIFILFVLKNRVYQALRKRLGMDVKKKPTCNTTTLHDPCKVKKSASNSTLTTTFAISSTP